ncbi:MAG: C69 family dipeptidase [Saprospiraceae bacterium]|nr:C69 family dipeptidase [Saprospiraceae bacterium]
MRKNFLIIALSLAFIAMNLTSFSCTNFLITKGASTDGSTMISYAADSHVLYGELYYWPAKKYEEGAMLDIYEWDTGKFLGKIKQAKETYNVTGNMNEWQVAIGETTYGGRKELATQTGAIMDYGSLIYIGLQRAKTAREAIKIITDLMAQYGYASSGESFSVSDANEVWILELIGKGEGEKGAIWVAKLVPDGYVCAHANQARITTFDYQKVNKWNDPKANTFNAPDVISFAKKKAWFKGKDKDFSFSDTYAAVDFGGARFCEIRVWAFFNAVVGGMDKYWEYVKGHIEHDNPNGYASNRMPLWIKPDKKVSNHDMMNFMRDHLEGTELDMSKDIGAGPFECPYRWRGLTWKVDGVTYCNERATATQQTGFSFVAQSRSWLPREIGGIFWFSVDDAASSVYFPQYSNATRVPKTFMAGNGSMMEWSDVSAFWAFNQVSNFAYTRYNYIHPEIAKKQNELETRYIQEVLQNDLRWKELDPKLAVEVITDYSKKTGDELTFAWKDFYKYLFLKYMDGNIKEAQKIPEGQSYTPAKVEQPGYGEDWYRRIVKETGDKFKVIGGDAH